MDILTYLAIEPTAIIFVSGVFGLVVGSFLNVVIYRLPIMLQREWQADLMSLVANSEQWSLSTLRPPTSCPHCHHPILVNECIQVSDMTQSSQPFNLVWPRSHCPHCQHQITALENIPVLSYIWQRGRCTACHAPISMRYPLVELLSALLSMITAWHFGFSWPLAAALILTWTLIALSFIDFDHLILPDSITLPMVWLGLFCNLFGLFTSLSSAVVGAIAGYLSLWSVFWVFKLLTGKEGMGYGDFKLLAMLGAWMGWQSLLVVVLISSFLGAIIGIIGIVIGGRDKNVPIPFGPYLAIAGWVNLLWGATLLSSYLSWTGF